MIWVDFVIIGVIFILVIKGVFQGIAQETFAIMIWMLAFWVGLNFSVEFSLFLESAIRTFSIRMLASFVSMLMMTLIVGGLIGLLLGEWVKRPELTFMDRLGGMVFGVAHGLIVVIAMVLLSGLTALPGELWWQESKLLPALQLFSVWLKDTIPSDMGEYIRYH